ncbi:TPA: hypothetical protein ACKRFJ_001951 [Proteus mirabilis]|nr:hypothetical protein [Proteus mirabilis]
MYIQKVISYKNAWEVVKDKYSSELSEIVLGLDDLFLDDTAVLAVPEKTSIRAHWEQIMYQKGWEIIDRIHYTSEGTRINISRLGPIKNGLCAAIQMRPAFSVFDNLSSWIFQQTTLAIRYDLIKMPVLLIPIRDFIKESNSSAMRQDNFEINLERLEMLSPLSHRYPFLILGYTNDSSEHAIEPEIIELPFDSYVKYDKPVIDRCIEFPPEYHQAGLDILNYFGTYLREQYPEENALVKIEQKGLFVRLIIETIDGKSEVIEKALHEYELIITGNEPPEKFTKNDKLVIELKNELRIAKFRIESQQDLIGIQNNRIEQLFNIISNGLTQKNSVMVDFKPTITLTNSMQINKFVASAVSSINELIEKIPESDEAHFALKELESSLISIEANTDQESVRRSSAMSKFKRLIDKIADTGSNLNLAIKKADKGWEIFSDLANRYNKLAEWCGLPVVPSALLK